MVRAFAVGDHHHLLAHPMAESGVLRHLSLAGRAAGGPARQHHPGVPHAIPLQELSRDRGPLPQARIGTNLDDRVPRLRDSGRELSTDRMASADRAKWPPVERCRADLLASAGLPPGSAAVGVDRFDYTKGILERLHAIGACSRSIRWVGNFTFMQVAAPTRARSRNTGCSGSASSRCVRASTNASAAAGRAGGDPARAASRSGGAGQIYRAATRVCHQPARRHGPRLQGVRRDARRQQGDSSSAASPVPRASSPSADSQSLPVSAPMHCTRR